MLGVARDHRAMVATARVTTTTPSETMAAVLDFFHRVAADHGDVAAFGIAAFGPIDVDRGSPGWGRIARTPKPGWTGADLTGPLGAAFGVPIGLDTDVNGALLAESRWGAARGVDVASYVTVGTGIGGGAMVEGRLVHGSRHPEMGHLLVRRHPADQAFAGVCPFHGDCLEGLASGPAIEARWGTNLSALPDDHPAHDMIAFYLAQLVVAQQALLSPCRIIFGGGVLAREALLPRIGAQAAALGGGYYGTPDYAALVVAPALGDRAGLLGGLALAQDTAR